MVCLVTLIGKQSRQLHTAAFSVRLQPELSISLENQKWRDLQNAKIVDTKSVSQQMLAQIVGAVSEGDGMR